MCVIFIVFFVGYKGNPTVWGWINVKFWVDTIRFAIWKKISMWLQMSGIGPVWLSKVWFCYHDFWNVASFVVTLQAQKKIVNYEDPWVCIDNDTLDIRFTVCVIWRFEPQYLWSLRWQRNVGYWSCHVGDRTFWRSPSLKFALAESNLTSLSHGADGCNILRHN